MHIKLTVISKKKGCHPPLYWRVFFLSLVSIINMLNTSFSFTLLVGVAQRNAKTGLMGIQQGVATGDWPQILALLVINLINHKTDFVTLVWTQQNAYGVLCDVGRDKISKTYCRLSIWNQKRPFIPSANNVLSSPASWMRSSVIFSGTCQKVGRHI